MIQWYTGPSVPKQKKDAWKTYDTRGRYYTLQFVLSKATSVRVPVTYLSPGPTITNICSLASYRAGQHRRRIIRDISPRLFFLRSLESLSGGPYALPLPFFREILLSLVVAQDVPLQFHKFITKADEKTDKWKLLQNETYIFKFFFFLFASFNTLLVARRRYSISCHAHCSILSSMVAMASVIICFRLVMSPVPLIHVGVHKVSLQFHKFITKANEKTVKWKLLQNETYVFKFFFFLSHLIYLYMGTISCTKHVRTVLDFLHGRCSPRLFLVVHSFLYRTVSLSP